MEHDVKLKMLIQLNLCKWQLNMRLIDKLNLIEDGQTVDQETRLFDTKKNQTRSMRSKEDAHDYRYFPDPDFYH